VAGKVPRQEAPEVVHEVFIRAFVSLPGYRPEKPLSHWLSTLAVRACHDFWRERYRRKDSAEAALSLDLDDRRETPNRTAGQFEAFESWQLLDWALGHLSPGDRMAVTLVHLEGWTMAEAARALGWSETVLKVRAFRARRKLRKIIAGSLFMEVADDQK